MSTLSFKENRTVYFENREYEIVKIISVNRILCRDVASGDVKTLPASRLSVEDGGGNAEGNPVKNPEFIKDAYSAIARKRFEIIKPLLRPGGTRKEAEERAREHGLSFTTIYRWIRMFETTGKLSSLAPDYENRGGKGKHRISGVADAIMSSAIEDVYLKPHKPSFGSLYREIRIRCERAGVRPPHENTVRSRIRDIPRKVIYEKRGSVKRSKDLYGSAEGFFEAKYPLDVVQIDHTKLDVILVNEVSRRPIGRPYITVAEDVYSRMVYGFYLSLDHPSFFTVGQCLSIGLLPKDDFLKKVGVAGEWNIWGLPGNMTIHTDNAKEFRGFDLKRFCDEHGINLSFRPVREPRFGGHIERFIETLNSEVHSLPGTTFSNTRERGEYKSEKEAAMTLRELERWITELIVNVYHKKIHSMIGMAPEKKYEVGVMGDEDTPGAGLPDAILGEDAEKLKISLLPAVERTVQRDGVNINKIKYFGDVLRKYIRYAEPGSKKKGRLLFKVDPRDISVVYFCDPEMKDYFPIPYRNIGFPPISLWELREINKYLQEKGSEGYDEYAIFKTYEEMKRIETEAVEKSKTARRKQARREHHKEAMGERKADSSKALRESAKDKSPSVQNAVRERVGDMFSKIKQRVNIEFVSKKRQP